MAEQIKLNNGLIIPKQGFGTFPYTDKLDEIIPMAAKAGFRMFDTSDDYHNEKELGKALRKTFSSRDEYTVITKFTMPTHPHEVEMYLRNSLKNLFEDSNEAVNIFLMHWPFPNVYLSVYKEMEKMYKKGLCKSIGVCNYNIEHLEALKKHCEIKPVINQFELHPFFSRKDLCDYCKANDIQVMCYSPLARMNSELTENPVLKELGEKHGKSVVQIVLRWDYQNGNIAIPAGSKESHISDNYNILDFEMSDDDMKAVDSLNKDMRVRLDPLTYFNSKQKMKFFLANAYYKVFGAKKY